MAQGVSQRSHTAVAHIKSQASAYEICGGRSVNGIDYSPSTSIFSCQYRSTSPPLSSSYTRCSTKKEN
jgi:hypothetical protein